MDRIITTDVVDPSVLQPFTARSLKFLQDASLAQYEAIMISIVGSSYSPTIPYVIVGVTGSGTNYSGGIIAFNGEIFPIDSANTAVNSPVIQYEINVYPDAIADPVTFTDSTVKNVHNKRKYVALTSAGTGEFDSSMFVFLSRAKTHVLLSTHSTTTSGEEPITGATFTSPAGGAARNYKVKIYGNCVYTLSAATQGAFLGIKNTTTSTVLAVNKATLNIGNIGSVQLPNYVEFDIVGLAPGSTIIGYLQRENTNNVTLQNGYWSVEEYF